MIKTGLTLRTIVVFNVRYVDIGDISAIDINTLLMMVLGA